MAVSSIGVGSGLPLEDLLADLRKSENTALNAIRSRQNQAETRLTAYGQLKSALDALNSAALALGDANTYTALRVQAGSNAFSATADSTALAGSYQVRVHQLASSQTLAAAGVADRTAALGDGGTLRFTFHNGDEPKTITLDLNETGSSLSDIANAINTAKDLGINATIVNDGSEAPHRLLLTTQQTGTEAAITRIDVEDNATLADLLAYDVDSSNPNMSVQEAQNAQLSINGIDITSQSNTVRDAIEGVTLTLNKISESTDQLSLRADDGVAQEAIKRFVNAYNSLQTSLRSLTSYDIDTQSSSALTGDSLARRLQNELRQAVHVVQPDNPLVSLSKLGITTRVNDGTLQINEEQLTEALKNNKSAVQSLLSEENGLSAQVRQLSDRFNRSDGLFSMANDGVSRTLTDLKRQYDTTVERIDNRMEQYRRQFNALDVLLAQMGTVSSYLTQQLSMLNNLGNDK